MKTIGVDEVKTHLMSLLERVAQGAEITITTAFPSHGWSRHPRSAKCPLNRPSRSYNPFARDGGFAGFRYAIRSRPGAPEAKR